MVNKTIFFCARANAKFSEQAVKHKKEHNSDNKRDTLMEFQPKVLLDVWETLSSFSRYFCPIPCRKNNIVA